MSTEINISDIFTYSKTPLNQMSLIMDVYLGSTYVFVKVIVHYT